MTTIPSQLPFPQAQLLLHELNHRIGFRVERCAVQVIHMAHERLADWLAGFERSIRLEGNLGDEECAQLMQAANMCPVGRTLGLSADIRTNDNVSVGRAG